MIYLASPYSHLDPAVRQKRFEAVCQVAADLIRQGYVVFSPIAHSHVIAQHGLPTNWEFWEEQDRQFIAACDQVWVLMIDGWEQSRGIHAELTLAKQLGKPIRFLPGPKIE